MSSSDSLVDQPMLTVTPEAAELVLAAREDEVDALALALWLEAKPGAGLSFAYDLYFQALADASSDDVVVVLDGVSIVVPAASVERLRGATLGVDGDGLALTNPNEPKMPDLQAISEGDGPDMSDPIVFAVHDILERQINPQIASHGGWARLVAVDGDTVFLQMGGGCQGCGMAKVTLTQGIEVAIKDAVPSIQRVVDVTDHASGTNPYHQAAKK